MHRRSRLERVTGHITGALEFIWKALAATENFKVGSAMHRYFSSQKDY